jgi:hypothetical protein
VKWTTAKVVSVASPVYCTVWILKKFSTSGFHFWLLNFLMALRMRFLLLTAVARMKTQVLASLLNLAVSTIFSNFCRYFFESMMPKSTKSFGLISSATVVSKDPKIRAREASSYIVDILKFFWIWSKS